MIERPSEPVTTHWETDDDPSQDTIALLQEEIARLEADLRARDDAPPPAVAPEPEPDRESESRLDELHAQLAERDEMVEILLEQTRLLEESASAQRAEWEQLNEWVEQVERRVDGRQSEAPRLQAELDSERTRSEALRRSSDSDRRDWEAHRVGLEREAQLLRDQLAHQNQGSDARQKAAFLELAAENRQLRTTAEALKTGAAESAELGRRLDAALVELVQARRELRDLDDDRQRERTERDAEIVALRSQLARESLCPQVETEPAVAIVVGLVETPARPSPLEADERIRAFRQHLKDLHETEAARRSDRSIASRLSRLWRHTGPT